MSDYITLIVGVGSDYGDDRLGWQVAQSIESRVGPNITIRKARTPTQMLDWLAGVARLVVIDACRGDGPPGQVHCWRWPDVPCQFGVFANTHDLGLVDVLKLADELGDLPRETVLFAATTSGPDVTAGIDLPLSAEIAAAIEELATRVLSEVATAVQHPPPTLPCASPRAR